MSQADITAMAAHDLADVHALQARCYAPALHEAPGVLAARLALYRPGCHVARCRRDLVAYLFSHPWSGPQPPPLNALMERLPAMPDHYYLHDLAVDESHRGQGLAQRLVAVALAQAEREGVGEARLVAVQASTQFWRRCGFEPAGDAAVSGAAASYGGGACLMIRAIGGAEQRGD